MASNVNIATQLATFCVFDSRPESKAAIMRHCTKASKQLFNQWDAEVAEDELFENTEE